MKIHKIAQSQDEYVNNATVNIYDSVPDREVESGNKQIPVNFRIDIEARSWGIKDISVFITSTVLTIPIVVTTFDANSNDRQEDRTIQVDLSKMRKHEDTGSGVVTVSEINIVLDQNFNIDYTKSYIGIDLL